MYRLMYSDIDRPRERQTPWLGGGTSLCIHMDHVPTYSYDRIHINSFKSNNSTGGVPMGGNDTFLRNNYIEKIV